MYKYKREKGGGSATAPKCSKQNLLSNWQKTDNWLLTIVTQYAHISQSMDEGTLEPAAECPVFGDVGRWALLGKSPLEMVTRVKQELQFQDFKQSMQSRKNSAYLTPEVQLHHIRCHVLRQLVWERISRLLHLFLSLAMGSDSAQTKAHLKRVHN